MIYQLVHCALKAINLKCLFMSQILPKPQSRPISLYRHTCKHCVFICKHAIHGTTIQSCSDLGQCLLSSSFYMSHGNQDCTTLVWLHVQQWWLLKKSHQCCDSVATSLCNTMPSCTPIFLSPRVGKWLIYVRFLEQHFSLMSNANKVFSPIK